MASQSSPIPSACARLRLNSPNAAAPKPAPKRRKAFRRETPLASSLESSSKCFDKLMLLSTHAFVHYVFFCAARHPVLLTDYAGFAEFAVVMYAVRNTLPVIFEIAVVMVRAGSVADLAEAF